METKYKIVFFGTPGFAVIILESLIKSGFKPMSVVTAPDKKVGRKQIFTPSPVKELALKHNISVLQPQSLKNNTEIINYLTGLNPDLFILAAYGLILPKKKLNIPGYGCLNVHPSLLPKYRGASPIQAAILNGDKISGITIIKMDEEVDHGPVLAQQELKMTRQCLPELSKQLAELGGKLLIKILPKWLNNKIKPTPQDHTKATITRRIIKQDGKIDWNRSAEYIERMTRAYCPWPTAFATLKIKNQKSKIKNKLLKILEAEAIDIDHQKYPGTIFLTRKKQLAVASGKDALLLQKIQLEGKNPISAKDFLNGYPDIVNAILT